MSETKTVYFEDIKDSLEVMMASRNAHDNRGHSADTPEEGKQEFDKRDELNKQIAQLLGL